MAQERLQKLIAKAGFASRRKAEAFIIEGRVRVNGKVVSQLGATADPSVDSIDVEGYGQVKAEPKVYIALHKPNNVISTARDPEGRRTVLDVLEMSRAVGPRQYEGTLPRLYPVGRLDFDAEGLVLLTNDGELAQVLTHPSFDVPRTYAVKVKGRPEERSLERLRRGLRLPSEETGRPTGRKTKPCEARITKLSTNNSWIELTLFEGRNHQVKRMTQGIGHATLRLVRTAYGGVEIGDLPPGAWRFLTSDEVRKLRGWSHVKGAPVAGRSRRSR